MENEIYKPIEGFPGYFVSDKGRVISTKRISGPHVIGQRQTKYGYTEVMLSNGGHLISKYVARLVLEAFVGYPADPWLCYVHHRDGDRGNCALDNLEWQICETTAEYNPRLSHRRGVLKPDNTKDKMSQAKYNQSQETIEKAIMTRQRTIRLRNLYR